MTVLNRNLPYQIVKYMVPQLSGEEMESHNYILRGYKCYVNQLLWMLCRIVTGQTQRSK